MKIRPGDEETKELDKILHLKSFYGKNVSCIEVLFSAMSMDKINKKNVTKNCNHFLAKKERKNKLSTRSFLVYLKKH